MNGRNMFVLAAVIVALGSAAPSMAYENVTAVEAYEMAVTGQAYLLDTRSIEEAYWVGSPANAQGEAIAYLIPYKLYHFEADGTRVGELNPDFDALFQQTFPDLDTPVILFCRSGGRSTQAAEHLESLGYTNLYEIDNAAKEATGSHGGRGGFQGTSYSNAYAGYRGYPGRLPTHSCDNIFVSWGENKLTVETTTGPINPESSVSWLDAGLPITQSLNPDLIPRLEQ